MDFFNGQETLTLFQWVLRAVVGFFFLLFAAKIMGKRSISQLRLLDFVMALLLGNIIAHPLSDEGLGLKGSMTTMTVLVLLYSASVYISLKSPAIRQFLDPSPVPLIRNGEILYSNLSKARITIDDLLAELRKEKIEDVQKVALSLWEADGSLTTFLHPQHQTVTAKEINLTPKPFSFPMTIIKDGKIVKKDLFDLGKDEQWLKNTLQLNYQKSIKDILLATLDQSGELKIFLYK
ncbi:DUF421 domain-containing protein [Rossellomorea sp. BNER]|uniref:DUF421 domain-containing protein n=1 Tax=Rossellomorea sp. BNER TaxID=2962031 RepID=UPI003AF23CEF|nr:DUF421 domain-containing protein [Rossellomorea sp. BNER]